MADDRVEIGTLRVRGARASKATIRRRLARRLDTAELLPPEIPPAAVLLVRRLVDPRPGALAPGRGTSRAWARAVQATLAEQYRHAARPVRGQIAGTPAAVCFADEAEMVACLALALGRGLGLHSWWWPDVLRSLSSPPDLAAIWQGHPTTLPPTLAHLASWGEAGRVVSRLAPEAALDLVRALARAYDLPALANFPAESAQPKPGRLLPRAGTAPAPAVPAAPWAFTPAQDAMPAGIGRAHAALLGTALTLQLRPAAVRAPAFGPALQRWWGATGSVPGAPLGNALEPPSGADAGREDKSEGGAGWTTAAGSVPEARGRAVKPARARHELRAARPAGVTEREGGNAAQQAGARPVAGTSGIDSGVAGSESPAGTPAFAGSQSGGLESAEGAVDAVRAGEEPQAVSALAGGEPLAKAGSAEPDFAAPDLHAFDGSGAATAAGGIFYLINVMRVLTLPGCFEQSWGLASQIGPWGVLELLGRGLLGTAGRALAGDPLWQVLAALDGRQADSTPGADFRQQGPGGLPGGWEEASPSWPPLPGPLLAETNPALLAWLRLALPPIAARLQGALELAEAAQLPQTLLLVPGRVHTTRSHVDLVMGLDAIRLPVRRAGLDATPGWLPHFGRVITFYFQE